MRRFSEGMHQGTGSGTGEPRMSAHSELGSPKSCSYRLTGRAPYRFGGIDFTVRLSGGSGSSAYRPRYLCVRTKVGTTSFEALYVGKATNIRHRIHQQLNNLRLMQHVQEAKAGRRILFVGSLIPKPGQKVERCLPIIERAFIRYFLSEGCDLVNIQGAKLRQHEVASSYAPRNFVPKLMYVDRSRLRR